MALAAQDDDTSSWVGTDDDLDSIAKTCHDPALALPPVWGRRAPRQPGQSDRKVVENLLREARQVLFTSTLAWGVIPARLVIVKGTEFLTGSLGGTSTFPSLMCCR